MLERQHDFMTKFLQKIQSDTMYMLLSSSYTFYTKV